MKYLPLVGPVTQLQSLDQHCTKSKIYWRYIDNQLDFMRSLCENSTLLNLVQPADSYSRGKGHNLKQSYKIGNNDIVFHSNM